MFNLRSQMLNIQIPQDYIERTIILKNFILTLPSILYHGTKSLIEKYKHNKKEDIIFNETDTKNLILLVHGYHGHPCNFIPLIDNIINIDSNIKLVWNVRAISLNKFDDYNDNTVDNEAKLLLNYLETNDFDNVVLVGLSKGGFVCTRAYSYDNSKINKIITISSPLCGTRSCDLFLPKILDYVNGNMDLVRNDLGYKSSISSDTLNILATKNTDNIYHIVPKYDHMIYPTETAAYDFVKEKNILRYNSIKYSHIGIPFNKDIASTIIEWINE